LCGNMHSYNGSTHMENIGCLKYCGIGTENNKLLTHFEGQSIGHYMRRRFEKLDSSLKNMTEIQAGGAQGMDVESTGVE
jgi:hypothetical protein